MIIDQVSEEKNGNEFVDKGNNQNHENENDMDLSLLYEELFLKVNA
jgi:hypothetical protein